MADLKRVLITGSTGMVGQALNFGIKVPHAECDIISLSSIEKACGQHSPSAILCLSSIDMRKCETDPLNAYKVNALGVYNASQIAEKRKIPLIIISSGALFYGSESKALTEKDTPNPQNIYGQSKYIAELFALSSQRNLIVRTGWLFGSAPGAKSSFIDKMFVSLRENKEIMATTDHIGSPTYLPDFIEQLKKLIESDTSGIYHVINPDPTTALEVMSYAHSLLGSTSTIKEISAFANPSGPKRSPCEALITEKLPPLRHWKDAVKEYLSK